MLPGLASGTFAVQIPASLPCMGLVRGSQPFQSPITETCAAFGAQTAKWVPSENAWAPSFSYSRLCVPSRNRYKSCPVRGTGRSMTVGIEAASILLNHANGLRSAISLRESGHYRAPGLPHRGLAADAGRPGLPGRYRSSARSYHRTEYPARGESERLRSGDAASARYGPGQAAGVRLHRGAADP